MRGEWTVDGSGADLYRLSRRLRATGQSGLKRNIGKAIRASTVPCRTAVKDFLRSDMPHTGGVNEWLARSSITSSVLTGPKTAGVVVRARKSGHDLRAINRTGKIRHPTFGRRTSKGWQLTQTAAGPEWWDHVLRPYGFKVEAALKIAQNETAHEAGFI